MGEKLELRLKSPVGAEPAVYPWPLPVYVSAAPPRPRARLARAARAQKPSLQPKPSSGPLPAPLGPSAVASARAPRGRCRYRSARNPVPRPWTARPASLPVCLRCDILGVSAFFGVVYSLRCQCAQLYF